MTKKDLFKVAVEVLESKKRARRWFDTKQPVLGGKKPLKFARDLGLAELEKVLRRIEQGIPQ